MKRLFLILAILLIASILPAADAEFPVLTGPVVDRVNLLTAEQNKLLSSKLLNFHKTKGSQIAVCIVPTTQPLTIEDYGIQLAQKWKIGRAKIDDGIIIIVAKNDRKMRIEVGYGLEHVVTDLRAGRIVDYMMAPEFRKGDFYKGVDSAVDSLITFVSGGDIPAISSDAAGKPSASPDDTGFNIGTGFIIGSILLFIVLLALGKTLLSIVLTYIPFCTGLYLMGSGTVTESAIFGGFSMLPFAFIAVMMKFAPAGSSSGSSGYSSSSYSSSSDSFSSSSSDSFSGGGGDFGGGGASGDW